MRKIEKTIYNFDELEKDVQEKLIEKEKESEYQSYIDFDLRYDMKAKAQELVVDYFGNDTNFIQTYYSLSYCQGDGAMIEFSTYIEDLNKKYEVLTDEEVKFITDKDIISDIKVKHSDNYYYHEYTFGVDFDYYNEWEFEDIKEEYNITESDFNTIDDRVYKLLDSCDKHYTDSQFIKDIINMNKELTKYGYDLVDSDKYYYDMSCILEMLREYEYYKDGELYYE